MQRCTVCNGRTISTDEGIRCMNDKCEGAKLTKTEGSVICSSCDEPMVYKGMNSWGEPNYACPACGHTTKL